VTYVNTAFFTLPLVPIIIKHFYLTRFQPRTRSCLHYRRFSQYEQVDDRDSSATTLFQPSTVLHGELDYRPLAAPIDFEQEPHTCLASSGATRFCGTEPLTVRETAILSFKFSLIFFAASYFSCSGLEYTTVSSTTILTSTSSVFTLLMGAVANVEIFTVKKMLGVLASLAGVVIISVIDVSGTNDENRGNFPQKSGAEVFIGDAMALFSAVLYSVYAVGLTKVVEVESRINMPLFFGVVGLMNVILLWPGFVILHFTGIESFQLPPTGHIWSIVLINASFSLISDMCWAYAVLMTSPLVVTVGLSLTIPLSLVGQMVLNSQFSNPIYWFGACVVILSFVFISYESKEHNGKPLPVTEEC